MLSSPTLLVPLNHMCCPQRRKLGIHSWSSPSKLHLKRGRRCRRPLLVSHTAAMWISLWWGAKMPLVHTRADTPRSIQRAELASRCQTCGNKSRGSVSCKCRDSTPATTWQSTRIAVYSFVLVKSVKMVKNSRLCQDYGATEQRLHSPNYTFVVCRSVYFLDDFSL